jgi:hypothetical protein
MKYPRIMATALSAVWFLAGMATVVDAGDKADTWKPLFDGKTLQGWHQFGEQGAWKVEDGVIVGQTKNAKLYSLLTSDQEYGDFTLRLKFQISDGNSGVYIRTEMRKPDEAHGMQIEIAPDGSNSTSGIYESYARGWLPKPTEELARKLFKKNDWNEFVISAKGPHIVVLYNGVKTVDFVDPKGPTKGHFALQQHSGCVNHVMFKDIAIRTE